VSARELDDAEVEEWWPLLAAVWPAFGDHYAATGERSVFELTDVDATPDAAGPGER